MAASEASELTCWLIDTRKIWQGKNIDESAEDALALVSTKEQEDIRRKHHLQDAKMSLASALLKRLFVAKTLGVPWSQITFSRKVDPTHGKPCYVSKNGKTEVEFNISHQAGLVALVGCKIPDLELGVDIVCVNERNEYRVIDSEGFQGWIDIYQDIFSPEESADMKYNADPFKLADGTEIDPSMIGRDVRYTYRGKKLAADLPDGKKRYFDSDLLIDSKLRRFYTFWCYKEAYIKLTGEALLAEWLKELEFRAVRAPHPATVESSAAEGRWGEIVKDGEVWLHGTQLDDVALQIQSFEKRFMISVAAKPSSALPSGQFPSFVTLDVENDVIEFAETN